MTHPRPSTLKGWRIIIFALVALGFGHKVWNSLSTLWIFLLNILIPIGLIGIVIYLYKYPPKWLRKMSLSHRPPYTRQRKKGNKDIKDKKTRPLRAISNQKKKDHPFRVIDGNKKKSL
ncbi:hypothetical protein [Thermoflavimicrobium daqui]|jgi:hypothetical protein|uniref:Uncharacterized protein n=1 Tax=Thermoflavimicrobium daqui TaxID=2137476 RepID=A0A364K8G4_9BACL|nr:hypothetical protein [Thermoflavimicrobium daqui]RAL26583.1 hypothetical protein DL897_00590 [Thermoflavimicrobium daqui]